MSILQKLGKFAIEKLPPMTSNDIVRAAVHIIIAIDEKTFWNEVDTLRDKPPESTRPPLSVNTNRGKF